MKKIVFCGLLFVVILMVHGEVADHSNEVGLHQTSQVSIKIKWKII